jgi:hypothetical protein
MLTNQGPSNEQSHYSDLYYTQKTILLRKCYKQYTNKQFSEIILVHKY